MNKITLIDIIKNPFKVVRNYNRLVRMEELSDSAIEGLVKRYEDTLAERNDFRSKYQQVLSLTGKHGAEAKVKKQKAMLCILQGKYTELKAKYEETDRQLVEMKLRYEHYGINYKDPLG